MPILWHFRRGIPPSRKTLSSSRDTSQSPSPAPCLPVSPAQGGPVALGVVSRGVRQDFAIPVAEPPASLSVYMVCLLSPPGPLSRPVSCVLTHPPSCVPLRPCALAESHDTQAQGCLCTARTSHKAMTPTEGARLHSCPFPSRSEGPHPASCLPNSTSQHGRKQSGTF